MNDSLSFGPPEVTDEDIRWACRLLTLPDDAFHGRTGDDPRQHVLRSMDTMDVAACPGSGKTTLLVAKLAILAEKWQYRTRGICVLSHTNVARSEIQSRLGNTTAGRRLLSYPHFVGTIHGFVNEFLALPLLRSEGFASVQFSTEIAGDRLWRLSGRGAGVSGYLSNAFHREEDREPALRSAHYVGEVCDIRLSTGTAHKELKRSQNSGTFRRIDQWKRRVLQDGYAPHDDTFAYAHSALHRYPYLASTLRTRFPLLFVDEAQDNSDEQSRILHRVFMGGMPAVTRQRFGDGNQAIFDYVGADGAATDVFPNKAIQFDLPSSHRFGQPIADLADPLGLAPYGMKGRGPREPLASGAQGGPHTIFLFREDSIGRVIGAYAELLAETFSEVELREGARRGRFTAVAQVHNDTGDDHKPRHVRHYWPAYSPDLTGREPRPRMFVQYVFAGVARARSVGESYPAADKVAEGILRLAEMGSDGKRTRYRRQCHRHLMELLRGHAGTRDQYQTFVDAFAARQQTLTREEWEGHWRDAVVSIAEHLVGKPLSGPGIAGFLGWDDGVDASAPPNTSVCRDNTCRCFTEGGEVGIRVGSIHSVKGETHAATLVLETFWADPKGRHNLELLLPWLCDSKPPEPSSQQQCRLKLHYVAMTRPTHLLCLAMKRRTFEDPDGNLRQDLKAKLEGRGWRVREV